MEIYIEIFILENVLINFCLLKLVKLTTKSQTSWFKILLASLFGSCVSVFSILILNNTLVLNLTKISTAILMLCIAFKTNKKQFFTNLILFLLFTYAFGGAITSLSNKQIHNSSFNISNKISLEIICCIFLALTYILELVVKNIKLRLNINNLTFETILTQENKSIKIQSYLDTGNFLNINNRPVLILDLNSYLKLTNSTLLNFLLLQTETISITTVNGCNNLKLLTIEKVEIKNGKNTKIFINQPVAINTNNTFKNTNYQALISPLFYN